MTCRKAVVRIERAKSRSRRQDQPHVQDVVLRKRSGDGLVRGRRSAGKRRRVVSSHHAARRHQGRDDRRRPTAVPLRRQPRRLATSLRSRSRSSAWVLPVTCYVWLKLHLLWPPVPLYFAGRSFFFFGTPSSVITEQNSAKLCHATYFGQLSLSSFRRR